MSGRGQYYDQETGLHYNYRRDFDPQAGRYVQSDPVGLYGGLNTYAYVENQPNRYVDPNRLNGMAAVDGIAIGGICIAACATYQPYRDSVRIPAMSDHRSDSWQTVIPINANKVTR